MKQLLIILPLLGIFSISAYAEGAAAASEKTPERQVPAGMTASQKPLDQANMDDAALLAWAGQAAAGVMTFSSADYQREIQESSPRFTKAGWESLTAWLQNSRLIGAVTARHQMVSTRPKGAATLVQEGAVAGKYRWLVTVPLTVTYTAPQSAPAQGDKGKKILEFSHDARQDTLRLDLVIERSAVPENSDGIAISQWNLH